MLEGHSSNDLKPIFKTSIEELYSSLVPTARKVVQSFTYPDDMSAFQKSTKRYLETYIKEISHAKLKDFLRFCTGMYRSLHMNV